MDNRLETEEGSYFQKIHSSPGMKFLNQLHARSFSLNIFQMNALELIEATKKVRDPDQGLALMSQANHEAGQQAHRELSRHIHNFVASAKTLVDHTRVFIEEHYANTPILSSYKNKITNVFSNDPVSKFVHDLRNYMLHKGLPNSQMFMFFEQDPENRERGTTLTTGIRFNTPSLLEWAGWTAPAKQYIEQAGEHINIHQFAEEYLAQVNQFHTWLEAELREHHAADLAHLENLQKLHANSSAHSLEVEIPPSSAVIRNASQTQPYLPFSFSPQDAAEINALSEALLLKVRQIVVPMRSSESFPSQRPISATLTDADMIGTPQIWGPDINGENVLIFIRTKDQLFGLSESDFADVEIIVDKLHTIHWVREKLSRSFIEDELLTWARENFSVQNRINFSDALVAKGIVKVGRLEVWAPIAHLEVESPLKFGPVTITPITSEKIDSLQQRVTAVSPANPEDVQLFFKELRHALQGFAAVVVTLEAEPTLAEERGLIIAQDAVNLLRFFSPAAPISRVLCPTALFGAEIVPRSKLWVLSDSNFSMTDTIVSQDIAFWRLPTRDIDRLNMMGLKLAGDLVIPTGLSDFAASIRSSLITYGKGITFPDQIDRINHAVSALEGIFLKHSMEPIESNISNRLSHLLSNQESERAEIAQNVRRAYRLKGKNRTLPLSPREQEVIAQFVANAHIAIQTALRNIGTFQTKANFIEAVDRLGLTG